MFAPVLQLESTEAREGAAALQADYDELRQQRFAEQVRVSPAQTLAQTMTTIDNEQRRGRNVDCALQRSGMQ